MADTLKKVAIIIGHSRTDGGARNAKHDVSEFDFNEALAWLLHKHLMIHTKITPKVVYRTTYAKLPRDVNMLAPDIAISLHCNAFDKKEHGSEVLYYKGSKKGELLARYLQIHVVECLGTRDRGVKPIVGSHVGKAGDRGGHLLQNTKMPCVIVEPFFIDSDAALEKAEANIYLLAKAYADAIEDYFASID